MSSVRHCHDGLWTPLQSVRSVDAGAPSTRPKRRSFEIWAIHGSNRSFSEHYIGLPFHRTRSAIMTRQFAPILLLPFLTTGTALSQGAAPLFTHSVPIFGVDIQAQAVLDLDHDGDDDVLTWFFTNPGQAIGEVLISAFEPDGEGHMLPMWTQLSPSTNFSVCSGGSTIYASTAVGDFDGDGHDDFAIAFLQEMYVYRTVAGQPPVLMSSVTTPSGDWFRKIIGIDLDGDGIDEITSTRGNFLSHFFNDGTGTFEYRYLGFLGPVLGQRGGDPYLATIDNDGDGREELIVRSNRSRYVEVFEFDGVSLVREQVVYHGLEEYNVMAVGDIDSDGDEDIVLFQVPCPTCVDDYRVLRAQPSGAFVAEPIQVGGPATHLVDIDGDGDLDGVCCGGSGCAQTNAVATKYRVTLNDGTGVFDAAIVADGLSTGQNGVAGFIDFDGDGDLDPVAGRTVLLNQRLSGASYCGSAPNSTGLTARLACEGTTSLSRSDMVLVGTELPANQTALLLLGGRAGQVPLGSGTLCLMAPIHRMAVGAADASGEVRFQVVSTDLPAVYPGAVSAGSSRRFQLWHRDTAGGGFALSSGVRVTFAP